MALGKKVDWWTLLDGIDEIMEGAYNSAFDNSEYVGYYDELITEMCNAAGDFYEDLDRLKGDIWYHGIPFKVRKAATEDDEVENTAFWFNTVALTITDTDVDNLFFREDNFGDPKAEKEKRLRTLERLPKKELVWLLAEVHSFIFRYMELYSAWETIKGVITELDSRQAFVKTPDGLQPPQSAYL